MENIPTPTRKPSAFRRPAIVINGAEKNSDGSSSDATDNAHFRKPMAPIQMSISPGNAANEDKLVAKLKSLELSRRKTVARSHPIDLSTPSKVDLDATERFYVESSVENFAHTPRTQSFREPFRTPAHNVSALDFARDSIRSNATYILTTPRLDRGLHPHNDPFTPALLTTSARKTNTVSTPLSLDEKLERQFVALSSWANVILDSASFVSEIDLGTSKQDASRKLQEMLTKPMKKKEVNEGMKGRYTDMCLRKKCLDYLKRADSVYQSTPIPGQLKAMVEKGDINVKPNFDVYANLGVQTSILSLLFTLHPFWLFIGVETVCAEFNEHDTVSLDARLPFSSVSFAPATVRFIHDHILANANYMSKKKFAIGTVKKIVTDKGREVLHKHCITCILSMAVLLEHAKNSYLFENTPGLFVKNSEIKTVSDFCTEFSRLVLSASGTPLNKAFDKNLFRRTYRQSFLEEYQYAMKSVRDMADGIILGRLVELLTDSPPLSIIGNMRNPQGDRIRKKGNVQKALCAASEAGIDVDGISIDQILGAHRESCLDLMWRLVGVYVKKKAEQEPLRRESLCLDGGTDVESDSGDNTVMGAPLGGIAESAFTVYQQLAFQFGLSLTKWNDLEDGLLLSSIWQHYNPSAPDVRFYNGQSLFDKVANAAESDLGIPLALTALRDERQIGLFAHMFLSRLISYKRLRDSEMSDAESDASSIVSIIRKEGLNLHEETERIQRVRLESERAISARTEEEEKRRGDELKSRFEEEEEERLNTEWRSPPHSSMSLETEERMMMNDGEDEKIEEEMRKVEERKREEEARIEEERLKKEEEERLRLVEEERMREEEDRRRMEKEEMERMRKEEEEEEERLRREEETRLEDERVKKEEEEKRQIETERIRLIEEARLKAEEEERQRMEEEERQREIEEARMKADEEERERREEMLFRDITKIIRAEEEERLCREREERREKAALTIQCWVRRVNALGRMKTLRAERDERLQKEEDEKRDMAALAITSWISDRLVIRAAKKELEERRIKRKEEEEEERMRIEEERLRKIMAVERIEAWYTSIIAIRQARLLLVILKERKLRREENERIERERWMKEEEERKRREEEEEERLRKKMAVERIEAWYTSILAIRQARLQVVLLKERKWRREEKERIERERQEAEERERQEEEYRRIHVLRETSAIMIQEYYRGWRLIVKAKEELKIRRKRAEEERMRIKNEERIRREEETRLEMERMFREEEERLRKKMAVERIEAWYTSIIAIRQARLLLVILKERKLRREENERIERERWMKEEEERKRREEEERLRWEEEDRLRREEEARIEMERRMKEEEERYRREEEERLIREEDARIEREIIEKEEEERRLRDEEEARMEMERQLKEEQERLKREEEEDRLEMERLQKEESRKREEEELREWAIRQQKDRKKEERIYEEMMVTQKRNERLKEIRQNIAAKSLQTAFRSVLRKRNANKRTVELLQRMDNTPRNENIGRMTMGSFSDDRILAGVREIKRRQRKLSLSLIRMSSLSRVQAATRIQAWWKGILSRRQHRVQIELIGVRMKEYNERTDKILNGDSSERAIPVSKRLERAAEFLQKPKRLYDIKVACYTIMSLCRLSSYYCEMAVLLNLHTLLIDTFMIQADRSPAFEEIIEMCGVHAIEELVKCSIPRVRESMIVEGGRIVKCSAHQMMAFHHNKVIVPNTMKVLRMCKEILPVEIHHEVFEKMYTYFMKKAEEKFAKLPPSDIRNKEFIELKKVFSK